MPLNRGNNICILSTLDTNDKSTKKDSSSHKEVLLRTNPIIIDFIAEFGLFRIDIDTTFTKVILIIELFLQYKHNSIFKVRYAPHVLQN